MLIDKSSTPAETVPLRVWNNAYQLCELSLPSCQCNAMKFKSVQEVEKRPFRGFADEEHGHFKAVYATHGQLYLQVDNQRWNFCDPTIRLDWKRLGKKANRIIISDTKRKVFSLDYPSALSDPVNDKDPTFDAADEEQQDFWLWLWRCASKQSWKDNILDRWSGPH